MKQVVFRARVPFSGRTYEVFVWSSGHAVVQLHGENKAVQRALPTALELGFAA
jgi:hypothetical protein